MATAALPARRSRRARAWGERAARAAVATSKWLLTPAKPVLRNLLHIPFTVAGFGCLDTAAFEWNTKAGLVAAGVLLIVLEHLIADET